MKALIDGDIVVFRAACSAEDADTWVALARADRMIKDILEDTKAIYYQVYLTGDHNFRRELDSQYKANRPSTRPTHWEAARQFLVMEHRAMICTHWEADDELGINQDKIHHHTVICSIDKDLLQIPGRHYNFVRKEFVTVTPFEGMKKLYLQALTGDASDNVFGIPGIGPVKANKALDGLTTEFEMYEKCREMYGDDERLNKNLQLLYIWRQEGKRYQPPTPPTTTEDSPDGEDSGTTTQQA